MPRLSIELTEDLNARMDKFLPWGAKQRVMLALCEQLCQTVEKHGRAILTPILTGEYNVISKEVNLNGTGDPVHNSNGQS